MRKPNPILLKLLHQAGAYPFDDIEEEDGTLFGVWVIPTAGAIPVVLFLHGNGHATAALQAELKRLSRVLRWQAGKPGELDGWVYEIFVECGDATSRVIDRKLEARTREEIVAMKSSFVFIPWFDPPDAFAEAYSGGFTGDLIPDTGVHIPDVGRFSVEEWDKLEGADTSFAPFDDGPTAEQPQRLRLTQFRPFVDTHPTDEGHDDVEESEESEGGSGEEDDAGVGPEGALDETPEEDEPEPEPPARGRRRKSK